MNSPSIRILRWIARLTGLLISGLFLFFVIGEAISPPPGNPQQPLSTDAALQLSFTGIGVAGLLLAWRWELAGGVIAFMAFLVLGYLNPRTIPWPLLAFILPAVMLIWTGLISRKTNKPPVPGHS